MGKKKGKGEERGRGNALYHGNGVGICPYAFVSMVMDGWVAVVFWVGDLSTWWGVVIVAVRGCVHRMVKCCS